MTHRRYDEADTRGFVVEATFTYPRTGRTTRSYWYGPDRIIPTVTGPLDYSVAVFATRAAAMAALNSIYGTPAAWLRRGYTVRRLAKVLEERAARAQDQERP